MQLSGALALLWRALRAPLTYWERRVDSRRAHEIAMVRAQSAALADALRVSQSQLLEVVQELTTASREPIKLMQEWLGAVKPQGDPKGWVQDEEAEARQEAEAAAQRLGVPLEELFRDDSPSWIYE